jgi:TP901 family phage tail tape measure protein
MADELKRVGLKFSSEGVSDFKASLRECSAAAKENYSELKLAQSQYDKNTSSAQKLADRQKYLAGQVSIYTDKVAILERQLEEMEQDENANTSAIAKKRAELNSAKSKLNEYSNSLSEVSGQLKNHTASLKEMGDKLTSLGGSIENAGKKMSVVSAGITAIGGASFKASADFDKSFAKLSTIADTTEVSTSKMRKQIIDLSKEYGVSASDIAEATYGAISAGQKTGDALDFVADSLKTAKAGFTDTSTSIDVLTTVMNAYGDSAGSAKSISDKLLTVQNLGKTTFAELGSSIGKVIPTASMYGVSLDNLASAYVTTTKNGIATAESTTYINGMLNELGKSGSKASEALRQSTGKSFKELMDSGMSLSDVLKIVDDTAKANGQSLADMFGSQEAAKAAATITQHSDDFKEALDQMGKSAGTTKEAFDKMENTDSTKMEKMTTAIQNAGIALGTTLGPVVTSVAGGITKLMNLISGMPPVAQNIVVGIMIVVAAIGPLLIFIGNIISAVGTIMTILPALSGALTLLTGPVGIVIAAIAAAIAIGVALYKNWDTVKAAAAVLGQKIASVWNSIVNAVKGAVNSVISFLVNLVNWYYSIPGKIRSALAGVGKIILNAFSGAISAATTWGKDLIDNFVNGIKRNIGKVTDAISGVAKKIKDFIGFSEPDKGPLSRFHTFAPDMIDLWTEGVADNIGAVEKSSSLMGQAVASGITSGGITETISASINASNSGIIDALNNLPMQNTEHSTGAIYLNGREITRSLKELGVQFT